MNAQEARKRVIEEGSGEEGIAVAIRMGVIPDSDRMAGLLESLEEIFSQSRGDASLDRELANALFGLAFHVQGEVDAMLSRGSELRESFIDDELVRMFLLIESIFEDDELF